MKWPWFGAGERGGYGRGIAGAGLGPGRMSSYRPGPGGAASGWTEADVREGGTI